MIMKKKPNNRQLNITFNQSTKYKIAFSNRIEQWKWFFIFHWR